MPFPRVPYARARQEAASWKTRPQSEGLWVGSIQKQTVNGCLLHERGRPSSCSFLSSLHPITPSLANPQHQQRQVVTPRLTFSSDLSLHCGFVNPLASGTSSLGPLDVSCGHSWLSMLHQTWSLTHSLSQPL